MTLQEEIREIGLRARAAARLLRAFSTAKKNAALLSIASALEAARDTITSANVADVAAAKAEGYAPAMIDRLTLTPERFATMVEGVRNVTALPDPVGRRLSRVRRPSGIVIDKIREPFGVIAVIFESRPNVFVDTAVLCLKASNAIILRGGREAIRSNAALADAVRAGLSSAGLPTDTVQFITSTDHAAVTELVRLTGLVDVAIPRGGEKLIRAVTETALVPVLKHYKGVCHVYVDDAADQDMALKVIENAKCQRPSVCNAAECVLVNAKVADEFMPKLRTWATSSKVTLHEESSGPDYEREYLSLDLNVKIVKDTAAAVDHINTFGSHHSDAIITTSSGHAKKFLRDVDSAAVYWNASTRFTDGGEFGMGAEIGVSTDKLHARGPMGLEELTTYKYVVRGDGTVR